MNKAGNKLKILLLAVAVVVSTGVITFLYFNAITSVFNLKKEIASLNIRYNELTQKNQKKDNYNYEIKYDKYEMRKLQKILPPGIEQERIILSLRRIEKASGAKITSIKFSPIEKVSKFGETESARKAAKENPPSPSPSPSASKNSKESESKAAEGTNTAKQETAAAKTNNTFSDGTQLEMEVEVSFRAPYSNVKEMLKEISREENRAVIDNISIQREESNSENLSGKISLTFCAIKDSKRSFADWQLQLEKGVKDLFLPFDGYGKSKFKESEDVILPKVEDKYKTRDITSDFYMLASPFGDDKPAVLIGQYETVKSEIFFDGNNTIDINVYVDEKDGEFYYRTRTQLMPYPDETNEIRFFPKQEDITMDVKADAIVGDNDKVRARLNVYNNTDKQFTIYSDDSSERVSVIVKQGRATTVKKALPNI